MFINVYLKIYYQTKEYILFNKDIIFTQRYQYKKFLNIFIKPSFILHILNN